LATSKFVGEHVLIPGGETQIEHNALFTGGVDSACLADNPSL